MEYPYLKVDALLKIKGYSKDKTRVTSSFIPMSIDTYK